MEADALNRQVAAARSGERVAIGDLLARSLPSLRAFVRLRMGPLAQSESASDLVQSVCLEALQALPNIEFASEQALRKWVFTAALHKLAAHRRYHLADKRDVRRQERAVDGSLEQAWQTISNAAASGVAMRREEIARMLSAFDQLTEEQREAITDARLLGLSHEEIGARMGRSAEAVRQLVVRGLAKLGVVLSRPR
jgi:RNA polymerase sigma factor (sigma-70 family)